MFRNSAVLCVLLRRQSFNQSVNKLVCLHRTGAAEPTQRNVSRSRDAVRRDAPFICRGASLVGKVANDSAGARDISITSHASLRVPTRVTFCVLLSLLAISPLLFLFWPSLSLSLSLPRCARVNRPTARPSKTIYTLDYVRIELSLVANTVTFQPKFRRKNIPLV